jgi:hypothetical protein
MTTEYLAPYAVQQFTDSSGNLLSGGKLFTYAAGTTTKLNTYTDNTGSTPNTNPIILNARGEAAIWIPPGIGFKFVLSPSTDTDPPTNPFWTSDQVFVPPVLPTPSSGNELYFVRVNAAGTAYEDISPAGVLSAIGAAPASGGGYAGTNLYGGLINSNTALSVPSAGSIEVYEVGSGSSAPFTITLPTPTANTRYRFIGTGGSYAASIATASGNLVLPDGTNPSSPYAGGYQQNGFCADFFADGSNWFQCSSSGQDITRAAVNPNQAPQWGQVYGGASTAGTPATYQDLTASRAFGTTYTNSTGKTIHVTITGTATAVGGGFTSAVVNLGSGASIVTGVFQAYESGIQGATSFPVPPGATYKAVATSCTLEYWTEFR